MDPALADHRIRPARVDEAAALHELTQRSTLYWGYEPAFLEWEPEAIAVTPALLRGATVSVLEVDGRVAGYYALVEKDATVHLDKLFVEPDHIGSGCGKRLWEHAVETARSMGYDEMLFDADPNAAPFYRAMGAEWLREIETSWPGWKLQVFRYRIPENATSG